MVNPRQVMNNPICSIDMVNSAKVMDNPCNPKICSIANAPSHATDVRLTKIYKNNQKIENANPTPLLYR